MTELTDLFTGYGYAPHIVDVGTAEDPDAVMAEAMDRAYEAIRVDPARGAWWSAGTMGWPVLLLRSPKGWTGPVEIDGVPIEGTFRAHQVPAKDAATNPDHLRRPGEPGSVRTVLRSCSTATVALSPISSPRARAEISASG